MSNFTGRAVGGRPSGNRFGGNRDRGGKPPFGKKQWGGGNRGGFDRGDRGPVTMHAATCANCGKPCEVPFKPTGDKPIYCKDCFGGKGAHGGGGFNKKPRQFDSPPAWKSDRPAPYVPAAGGQKSDTGGMASKQLELVNSKLDTLITAVEKLAAAMTKTSEVGAASTTAVEKSAKRKVARKAK